MTATNATTPTPELPFHLRGNYAPVFDEVSATAEELVVEGSLPPGLNGLYLRNGPNPHTGRSGHWFMGDGMLHGIRLDQGKASWYRNRYVQTRSLNEPDARMIGDDGSVDRTIGVNNTHVIRHADRILALVESSFPSEIAPDLSTVGPYDYNGRLDTAMTAHPKVCPLTGELHFFGYGFFPPYLTYHRVSAAGELVHSQVIDVPGPTMVHDFSITEHYVLFMDLPVVFDLELAMQGTMPYRWDEDYGARIGVLRRTGAGSSGGPGPEAVRWFDIDPCYVFHPMNSFEDGAGIVFDTARYPELWRSKSSNFNNDAALHRWRIDLGEGTVSEEVLDDRAIEFPRVNENLVGLPNCFGYAVATFGEQNSLVKYDLLSGVSTAHDFGAAQIPGEAVFAPSGAQGEDAGWLLTYVYDKPTDSSSFVVLDASDIAAAPVASIRLPQRVPFGFHGSWLPD